MSSDSKRNMTGVNRDGRFLKLGKRPATRTAKLLKFRDFLQVADLPPIPSGNFGHDSLIRSDQWGMFGNDRYGDCVLAGAAHEHMLWNAESGVSNPLSLFSTDSVLKSYSEVTGFSPADPNSDQGTDMEAAAKYRRTTGIPDAMGGRHKIGVYVDLTPGSLQELWYAIWLFDGVGIGVEFPSQWMDAFNAGANGLWDSVKRPRIEGGHYITAVGRMGGRASIVTWADDHPRLTAAGYQQFNDQTLAYISKERLIANSQKDANGYDWAGLLNMLSAVTGEIVVDPDPGPSPEPTPIPTPPNPNPNPVPPSPTPIVQEGTFYLQGTLSGTFQGKISSQPFPQAVGYSAGGGGGGGYSGGGEVGGIHRAW